MTTRTERKRMNKDYRGNMTTIETITIRQIEDLRAEGRRVQDKEMVIFCNKALQGNMEDMQKCVTVIQHREAGDFKREYE